MNEKVKDFNTPLNGDELRQWICECANDDCIDEIRMSGGEYETVRTDGTRFFVTADPEHVWPDLERIVERNDRYWVVEKFGEAGKAAQAADPRAQH